MKNKYKKISFIIMIIIIYQVAYTLCMNINLKLTNEEFINKIIDNISITTVYKKNNNWINGLIKFWTNVDLKKPSTIITSVFNERIVTTKHINYELNSTVKEPLVYIFNNNQLDNYNNDSYAIYGITPNTLMASYLLQNELKNIGIESIVDNNNIEQILKNNNITKEQYFTSEITKINQKYSSLKIMIDLRRSDLIDKEGILFLIGTDNKNYQNNLKLSNQLNNTLVSTYPSVSKGVLQRVGTTYNQDINAKIVTIEIGNKTSNIEDIQKILKVLARILKENL